MANIHRSQEVYKRIEGMHADDRPLRAVRGLYVSGTHLNPEYIDHNITITDFTESNPLVVVNFTERTETTPDDHVLNFIGMDVGMLSIDFYSTATATTPDDHVLNFIGCDVSPIEIEAYGQSTKTVPDDHVLNFIGLDVSEMSVSWYSSKSYQTSGEHMITVRSFTSTDIDVGLGS